MPPYLCYQGGGVAFTRFSCIKLNDFFHMIDGRYYHSFTPGINKFEGYETDDFVSPEATYTSGNIYGFNTAGGATIAAGEPTTPHDPQRQAAPLLGEQVVVNGFSATNPTQTPTN
jgi:hypothetical protein